jgi:hypothetical protein
MFNQRKPILNKTEVSLNTLVWSRLYCYKYTHQIAPLIGSFSSGTIIPPHKPEETLAPSVYSTSVSALSQSLLDVVVEVPLHWPSAASGCRVMICQAKGGFAINKTNTKQRKFRLFHYFRKYLLKTHLITESRREPLDILHVTLDFLHKYSLRTDQT